jgi:hypothetical protein
LIIQYFNMNRSKYKNYALENLSSEHIILNFIIKLLHASTELKIRFFMRS